MRLEPLIAMPSAWSSVYERFGVHLFEGHVGLEEIGRLRAMGGKWTAAHPGKRVELSVIFDSGARMSLEERSEMAVLIKLGEKHRAAAATVILAEGIVGSMQRSVLTGMMMLAPAPHPAKVFGAVTDATRWLFPFVREVCPSVRELYDFAAGLELHIAEFRTRPDRGRLSSAG